MKKSFLLALASLFLISCSSKKVVATTAVTSDCPWQMGHMNGKTIQDFQLSYERLEGSKVSIGTEIKLELPTEHVLDSAGRHNFYQKGIFLPAGSVGVIDKVLVTDASIVQIPEKIFVTFTEKRSDDLKPRIIRLAFEYENSKETKDVVLMMKKDVTPKVYSELISKGIKVDEKGYLRNGNFYYQMVAGKPVLYDLSTSTLQKSGKYRLSFGRVDDTQLQDLIKTSLTKSNGYFKAGNDYLVFDSLNSEIYLNSGVTVYLDQIKFRICSELQNIRTEGFDDKK